ncbi:MAG: hypothetical protein ACD_17C00185G0001 [uncultured bacterium]|nr:MAG: hypothetical protein ACD_17C00185G0001 [uncultured bacterium]OGN55295.1 MAG: hypothetical protein A2796_02065 [Chlamydiae bacterium RIFCSPHIGHO2_01_FULL_44_39]OGN58286.1 MAG: hypothetical protein A3C42_05785 [Chlamydiae bacterium RIFCSPHIGHO2_02_FULL_45_9]OGN59810.1 MAG: hypothetical protein A3D96_06920 [Chlamydiae bacterium RIFCSPHIGHO2_12_FULL_44_59]OGN65908.1 MAG: hypothetical protein A2978_05875 [Chlamydiae bacterium RIFCSPLOWO2_01_FULL_44_52]OGN68318.1 MAG: hypothetical protein A3
MKNSHWICIPNRHKEMAPFFFLCLDRFCVERRSSYPYMTGDTWRFFCNWQCTEKEEFDPKQVKKGDTVFVEYQLLESFQKIAQYIQHPFILITPNVENYSDNPLPGNFIKLLKNKNVAAWFMQNIDCPCSERLIPIPIGLSNDFWTYGKLEGGTKERHILAYVNFNVDTNLGQRTACLNYFSTMVWAHRAEPKTFSEYVDDLSHAVFVISPPGSGLDCHRTWEALYMGCYPIVLRSTLCPLYEELPVVVVDSWEEVTEDFLHEKKETFRTSSWNFKKIYMPYWFEKVTRLQQELVCV